MTWMQVHRAGLDEANRVLNQQVQLTVQHMRMVHAWCVQLAVQHMRMVRAWYVQLAVQHMRMVHAWYVQLTVQHMRMVHAWYVQLALQHMRMVHAWYLQLTVQHMHGNMHTPCTTTCTYHACSMRMCCARSHIAPSVRCHRQNDTMQPVLCFGRMTRKVEGSCPSFTFRTGCNGG